MSDRKDQAETLRLVSAAIARQWPVSPEKRADLVEMLHGLAMSSETRTRQRITCVRVIIQAEQVSLNAIQTAIKADEHEHVRRELAALAEQVAALNDDQPPRILIPDRDERLNDEPSK